MTDSLQATEAAAAAIAKEPRVWLDDIEAAMGAVYYTTADRALSDETLQPEHLASLSIMTICVVVMKNGFTVIGKSAPASMGNFNAKLGQQFAYEDAVRQLWPLMGFALCEELRGGPHARL
jgi:Phage protein (N4 Gp49/phage Sf6 gene 66) family